MGNLLTHFKTMLAQYKNAERSKKYGSVVKQVIDELLEARGSIARVASYKTEATGTLTVTVPVPLKEYSQNIINTLSDLAEKLGVEKVDFFPSNNLLIRITKEQAKLPVIVPRFQEDKDLQIPLGLHTQTSEPVWLNLRHNPHLLIAGSTGKGKSVCLENIIMHVDQYFDDTRFIMVDPKRIELSAFDVLPKLHQPIITEPDEAVLQLRDVCTLMDDRYRRMKDLHTKDFRKLHEPRLFVIVDEYADLMMTSRKLEDEGGEKLDIEKFICRIAQLGRAAGIHLIIATQRPSVDVITGLIKNNIPTRIAFGVGSSYDSKTILDESGAESLPSAGFGILRDEHGMQPFKGVLVSEKERDEYLNRYPTKTAFITRPISDAVVELRQQEKLFYGLTEGKIREYLGTIKVYRNVQARNDLGIAHAHAHELGKLLDTQSVVKHEGRIRHVVAPEKFSL